MEACSHLQKEESTLHVCAQCRPAFRSRKENQERQN